MTHPILPVSTGQANRKKTLLAHDSTLQMVDCYITNPNNLIPSHHQRTFAYAIIAHQFNTTCSILVDSHKVHGRSCCIVNRSCCHIFQRSMRSNIQAPMHRLVHTSIVNNKMSKHLDGGSRPIAANQQGVFLGVHQKETTQ